MKIKYFSWLKNITEIESEIINNADIQDIESLKKYLCKKYPKIKDYVVKDQIIRIAVNLEYASDNIKITDQDEIALFPPVSGG